MRRFRHFSLTFIVVAICCVAAWYGTSELNYDVRIVDSGRMTGAWFELGLPMIIITAIVGSLPFSWLARSGKSVTAWLLMLGLTGCLLVESIVSSSPAAVLNRALRCDAPPNIRIEKLRELQSFGDGPSFYGVVTVEPEFVERLKEAHAMKPSSLSPIDDLRPDGTDEEEYRGFAGAGLTCYYDATESRLYFRRSFESSRR